jgi:hypothetical protein
MPNGKPADHPLTDILLHGGSAFGVEIDSVVRELAALKGFENVRERVANLLWENWPQWPNVTPDLPRVRKELAKIRGQLTKAD